MVLSKSIKQVFERAHVRAIFRDIVRSTYEEKMVMGCLQIPEIAVKHLRASSIYGPLRPVCSYRNPLGNYLTGVC